MISDLPLCKLSDEEVVSLAKNGDEEAYSHIMTRYRNFVYAKAKTYYIKGADREDLIQEGMIGLYKAVQDFKPEVSGFAAFAKVCVLRQIITAVRNSTRNKHMPLNTYISIDRDLEENDYIMDIPDETPSANPESMLIDNENVLGIEYKINQNLSKLELEVLSFYLDGLSYQDIAAKMGKSQKTVDNAIQRIRKKIKKILSE